MALLQPERFGGGDWGDRARLTTTTKSLGNTTERASRLELRNEKAKLLIRRDALTVPAGTPLRVVIPRMQAGRGDCVLVIRDGRLVGIVTERDILMKVLGRDTNLDRPVDELMTPGRERGLVARGLQFARHGLTHVVRRARRLIGGQHRRFDGPARHRLLGAGRHVVVEKADSRHDRQDCSDTADPCARGLE